jgi:hypothetical protein
VERVVDERRQPAKGGGVDAHDLDTVSDTELVDPQPGPQQLPGSRLGTGADAVQQIADAARIDLDPLAP